MDTVSGCVLTGLHSEHEIFQIHINSGECSQTEICSAWDFLRILKMPAFQIFDTNGIGNVSILQVA